MTTRHRLRAALAAPLLVLGATCGDETSTSPNPPDGGGALAGAIVRDGIEYRADVLVMESFPVQLAGRATIRNTAGEARTVTFPDGCVALMRAYRPEGRTPAWDQAHEIACTQALVPVELDPGASHEARTPTASAYDVLAGGLPDGTYRITVYLRPVDAGEVELEAGTVDLAIPR